MMVAVELSASTRAALRAALEVGAASGLHPGEPVILQDTNNVVIWLRPHEVVAKVGVWAYSATVLGLEVDVSSHLTKLGAPVAEPLAELRVEPMTGLPVSLWRRLATVPGGQAGDSELADMLGRVHAGLWSYAGPLPSFLAAIDLAEATLFDDTRMALLARPDLEVLRVAFAELASQARRWSGPTRPLHGEPHTNNVVVTEDGPTLVDFEAASIGPLEWDLASVPAGVASRLHPDEELLALMRLLNSARVATWGWAQGDHPVMRQHGQHHLEIVRSSLGQ